MPWNNSPRNPPPIAQQRAMTPPAMAVITSAISSCAGPIHAPIAAHSFTSPIPMPPSQQRMPKSRAPSPRPQRLSAIPCQPWSQPDTRTPANRKGSTSQLGMRRLRRSVKRRNSENYDRWPPGDRVHTETLSPVCRERCWKSNWPSKSRPGKRKPEFRALRARYSGLCARLFTGGIQE